MSSGTQEPSPRLPPYGRRHEYRVFRLWDFFYSNEVASEDRPAEICSPEQEYYYDHHQRPRSPIRN